MTNIKIISSSDEETVETEASSALVTSPASSPNTISIMLEVGGEAVFHTPTLKQLRMAEHILLQEQKAAKKQGRISPTELCRKLGELCLAHWGDRPNIPPDEEIDACDDTAMLELFLKQLGEGTEEDLPAFEVLGDRSHRVSLSCGSITFRRLNRKDLRVVENSQVGAIATDILLAVSCCTEWWRSDRPIMPADLDSLTLEEYGRVSKALQGFLERHPSPK